MKVSNRVALATVTLLGLVAFHVHALGQDKVAVDVMWPSLGGDKRSTTEGNRPPFTIDLGNLEWSQSQSGTQDPDGGCLPSQTCWINIRDFFAQWSSDQPSVAKSIEKSTLRPGVMMHHYREVLVNGHYRATGTYVFFLTKQGVFYLWGDCFMNHWDSAVGPLAGDPRVVLKKLAELPTKKASNKGIQRTRN